MKTLPLLLPETESISQIRGIEVVVHVRTSQPTIRTGIVRNIPTSVSLEEIKEGLESPCEILDIQRMNRRITINGESKTVPSSTIKIFFDGQELPRYIFIFKFRYEVVPFVPQVKVCFQCFRIGHIGANCKSSARCLTCGKKRHPTGTECPRGGLPPKCLNCGLEHFATAPDCGALKKYTLATTMAAYDNIPLMEAKRRVKIIYPSHDSHNSSSESLKNSLSIVHSQNNSKNSYDEAIQFVRSRTRDRRDFPPLKHYNNSTSNSEPLFYSKNSFEALESFLCAERERNISTTCSSYAHVVANICRN
ncbi:uncharacterized protein LOC120357861 [Solenopsis invicta]|uniref:uncharacterized protein LOC120357861 n=1 Tax=Solenopsis invicta TaxID=13686 RepID=UPI00193D536C|nr:uncharacterized protein LOC120357861 [Solenopsis invicta]